MDRKDDLTESTPKEKLPVWVCAAVSFFFTFSTIFYVCLTSYHSARNELWFGYADFMLPLLALSAVVWIAVFALCRALDRVFPPLFWGLGLCAYLQFHFLNVDVGVLDGREIDWSAYGHTGLINLLFWGAVLVLSVALLSGKKRMRLAAYIGLTLVVMQSAALVSEFLTSEAGGEEHPAVLTSKDLYAVGSHDNIVVIVLDTFDVRHIEFLAENNDPVLEELDGFTFYDNAVSPYPKTATSVPYMLTGQIYRNERYYPEHLAEAFADSELLNALSARHYDMGIYTAEDIPVTQLADTIDNVGTERNEPTSQVDVLKKMLRYALFREAPHLFKKHFVVSNYDFSSLISQTGSSSLYACDNALFYRGLQEAGLQKSENSSAFRFIHLNGMHEPLNLSSQATYTEKSTVKDQLAGCMKIVTSYLDELRRLDVYDETAVLILGDHGAILGNQPALLYKPFGASGRFRTSSAAVEYGDLHQTLLQAIGLSATHGENIPELTSSSRERMYYDYRIDDPCENGYFPTMWEAFYLEDNAHPCFTGSVYNADVKQSYQEIAQPIKPGQTLEMDGMRPYFNSNFLSWGTDEYIFSMGLESVMLFSLGQPPASDVVVEMNCIEWVDERKQVDLFTMQDQFVQHCEYGQDGKTTLQFTIPREYFDDQGTIALKLHWKSDTGRLTAENDDLRKKQVGLKSFTVRMAE